MRYEVVDLEKEAVMTELAYPSGLQHNLGGCSLQSMRDLLEVRGVFRFRDVRVEGLAFHSHEVRTGSLFFAVPGGTRDGAEFVDDAVERGAVAVVAEREIPTTVPLLIVENAAVALAKAANLFYESPSSSLSVIGITGTNGKTTTSYLVRHCLEMDNRQVGLMGTIAYEYAGRRIPAHHTTPDAVRVHGYLREMADRGLGACVMEVSSHSLSQHRVHGVQFRIGAFLNLSQEHLDYHRTMREYARAKSELFRSLVPGAIACLNLDDPASETMYQAMPEGVVVRTFGRSENAQFRAENVRCSIDGTRMRLCMPRGSVDVHMPLVGEFNVQNALAAASIAHAAGVSELTIATALETCEPPRGRLERVETSGTDLRIFVDYAHTPDALENVLDTLRTVRDDGQSLSVVVGCGGDRDQQKRTVMARIAGELADRVFLTSDNPRSEDPEAILDTMECGLTGLTGDFYRVSDREDAIRRAIATAPAGEIVLIAGKGHEAYQILGDSVVPFDDVLVARDAAGERAGVRRL